MSGASVIDLRLGDCLDIMPTLEAQSVDAVIADIPYGTTACKWDTVIPFAPMWAGVKRVIKPRGAILLFGSEPFSSMLRVSNLDGFKYDWIWDKKQGSSFTLCEIQPLKSHEIISVFGFGGINYYPQKTNRDIPIDSRNWKMGKLHSENGNYSSINADVTRKIYSQKYPLSVIEYNKSMAECNNTQRVHPTQKPVALMEYLVKTYTNEGDTVLDFTMGSGTTMVACVNTKRNGIGFEILPDYFAIAQKRIAEAQQQMVLL